LKTRDDFVYLGIDQAELGVGLYQALLQSLHVAAVIENDVVCHLDGRLLQPCRNFGTAGQLCQTGGHSDDPPASVHPGLNQYLLQLVHAGADAPHRGDDDGGAGAIDHGVERLDVGALEEFSTGQRRRRIQNVVKIEKEDFRCGPCLFFTLCTHLLGGFHGSSPLLLFALTCSP
jgi:hypothetical protein